MQTPSDRLEWNSWNGHLVRDAERSAYLLHVPTRTF